MYQLFLDKIRQTEYNIVINSLVADFIDTYIDDIDALRTLKHLLDEKIVYDEFDKGTLYFSKLFLEKRIANLDFEHKLRIQRTTINMGFAGL